MKQTIAILIASLFAITGLGVISYTINTNLKAELESCRLELEIAYTSERLQVIEKYKGNDTLYAELFEGKNYTVAEVDTFPSPQKVDNLFWNYSANKIGYKDEDNEMYDDVYIPQHKIALDTYKWYRKVRKYSVRKSIRLTEEYWTLNLDK
jgi:hypothetical protein